MLPEQTRLDDVRINNFDLIRLFAAIKVVLFHTIMHLHLTVGDTNYLIKTIKMFPSVPIFFVLGGFLISQSFDRKPQMKTYLLNRVLRIYPALVTGFGVSLVILFCFGYLTPAVLSSSRFYVWVTAQLTAGQFYDPGIFRDFGTGVVNGSLGIISIQLQFYLIYPIVFLILSGTGGKFRQNLLLVTSVLFSAILYVYVKMGDRTVLPSGGKILYVTVLPYLFDFVLGILVSRNFNWVLNLCKGKFLLWTAIHIALKVISDTLNPDTFILKYVTLMVTHVSLVAWIFSFAYSFRQLSQTLLRGVDISYGIYIYHMLIVNVILELGYEGHWGLFFIVLCFSVIAAGMSRKFVELPALKLKKYSLKLPSGFVPGKPPA